MFSQDTSSDILRKQFDILSAMDIQTRAKITFDLCRSIRDITEAGIKQRHPEWNQQQINLAYLETILDKNLFEQYKSAINSR